MTTTQPSSYWHPADDRPRGAFRELLLNPRAHRSGLVPGRGAAFDLEAFSHALVDRDLDYQLFRYAADAEIRIVDPDNPPGSPRLVHGTAAIRDLLWDSNVNNLDVQVTHVVDGGDRVAFAERRHRRDGTTFLTTSAAELADGLITLQHTIMAWHRHPFTRPSAVRTLAIPSHP